MNFKEYTDFVQSLSSPYFQVSDPEELHGIIGIASEAGELLDQYKKSLFYLKPIDKINMKEELGDIWFFMNLVMARNGWTIEEIQDRNVNKLCTRYKKGTFSKEEAINRDLQKERAALEQ